MLKEVKQDHSLPVFLDRLIFLLMRAPITNGDWKDHWANTISLIGASYHSTSNEGAIRILREIKERSSSSRSKLSNASAEDISQEILDWASIYKGDCGAFLRQMNLQ